MTTFETTTSNVATPLEFMRMRAERAEAQAKLNAETVRAQQQAYRSELDQLHAQIREMRRAIDVVKEDATRRVGLAAENYESLNARYRDLMTAVEKNVVEIVMPDAGPQRTRFVTIDQILDDSEAYVARTLCVECEDAQCAGAEAHEKWGRLL